MRYYRGKVKDGYLHKTTDFDELDSSVRYIHDPLKGLSCLHKFMQQSNGLFILLLFAWILKGFYITPRIIIKYWLQCTHLPNNMWLSIKTDFIIQTRFLAGKRFSSESDYGLVLLANFLDVHEYFICLYRSLAPGARYSSGAAYSRRTTPLSSTSTYTPSTRGFPARRTRKDSVLKMTWKGMQTITVGYLLWLFN